MHFPTQICEFAIAKLHGVLGVDRGYPCQSGFEGLEPDGIARLQSHDTFVVQIRIKGGQDFPPAAVAHEVMSLAGNQSHASRDMFDQRSDLAFARSRLLL